jgi:EmrB/QacA subfamily drug resistance transporter
VDAVATHRRRWYTLLVLCMSLLVIGIDNTILNVALPTLSEQLGATSSQLQWIVDAYVIVFAGLLLTAGAIGDRFGRKKALTGGLLVFGIGSVLAAFSGSAGHLISTRALMGAAGAFIMPATLSILTNVFTDAAERAKAIGVWAGVSALGIAIGPLAGGWLLEHFSWGSVFLVNIPFVIAALVAGHFLVPESADPDAPRLDLVGAALSIAGLVAFLWGIIEAPGKGWTSPEVLVALGVGAAVLGLFVAWELRSDHPMLDIRFFRNPRFSAASGAITLSFFAMFGAMFVLTQYLQAVLGYSALQAGLRLAPISIVLMIVAPTANIWVKRFGSKYVVATGLIIAAGGLVTMSRLDGSSSAWQVTGVLALLGLGMGNVMAPATDSIMGSLPRERAGVGSAVNDTTREIGGALGVAIIGSLLASSYRSSMDTAVAGTPLPPDAANAVRDSIGGAVAVSQRAAADFPQQAAQLLDAARDSFVSAMRPALMVGAAFIALGALVVLFFLPARAEEQAQLEAADLDRADLDPAGLDGLGELGLAGADT